MAAFSHDHDHDDAAGHNHPSGGDHAHAHAPANFGMAFGVGIALNLGFVALEATYGILSNSVALIADAGHNFSDVLGLVVAWVASILTRTKPSRRYTYGLRSSSILAALANAVFLLVAVGAVAYEGIQRLFEPAPVAGLTVIVVAAVGIAINGVTALLFMKGSKGDLNIRGAFLHMAADAAVSMGVVVAGFVILGTGWLWLDPAVSLLIVVVIMIGTWGLLRDAMTMSLHAVPPGIDPQAVRTFLSNQVGVVEVHDLHIWAMSTTETALTCHLVIPSGYPGDGFLVELAHELQGKFAIQHATMQVETVRDGACVLAPDHVV
jgi:cobalt-zinc-cadmium efflux system protein